MAQNEELAQSLANHGVLVELKDALVGLSTRFDKATAQQIEENVRIHESIKATNDRVEETQREFVKTISGLKDGIAERGRITLPMVSVFLAVLIFIGGVGASYVNMTITPLRAAIDSNAMLINQSEIHRLSMEASLQELSVKSAIMDAKSETDRLWIIKLMDEIRLKKQ